ncbi:MAG: RidA family protein [Actinobacteria bacterium]|jgi:enamine deaminase RidA (YjgF/YER057c/UK114 family)|nr:RidA family protein [Actinomycetota bacterium]
MAADKLISSGGPWESVIGYSRAVKAGPYVHVSGTTATLNGELQHPGDAYSQAKVAYSIIEKALAEVGYGLEDVVRVRIYLTDEADMDSVGKANGELFSAIKPALTILAGLKFINPQMLVEIEADAYKA